MGWCKLYAVSQSLIINPVGYNFLMEYSVSLAGTQAAKWDKDTWEPLADLAKNHPEAGVHFQGM